MKERILVAGIGNIFFGDDAFGVEVIRRLAGKLPASIRVEDFGIRGYDLAFALMDGYEAAILVDAMPRQGAPGTLYTLEPDLPQTAELGSEVMDGHGLTPAIVLRLVREMGGTLPRVLVLGCEPATLGDQEDGRMGLSPVVDAAADEAVKLLQEMADRLLERGTTPAIEERLDDKFEQVPNLSGEKQQ